MSVCACFRPYWAGGSGLCSDVIGAAGWGDMGLEFGRGPDSNNPQMCLTRKYVTVPACVFVCFL